MLMMLLYYGRHCTSHVWHGSEGEGRDSTSFSHICASELFNAGKALSLLELWDGDVLQSQKSDLALLTPFDLAMVRDISPSFSIQTLKIATRLVYSSSAVPLVIRVCAYCSTV